MPLTRRNFLRTAAGAFAAANALSPARARATGPAQFKVVAFDAFAVFDPRSVVELAEALFPGRGAELGRAWRTRQFEYQWLLALSGHYEDFWGTTERSLVFAARQLQLDLTAAKHNALMRSHLVLRAWPDVRLTFDTLRGFDARLAILSNMTPQMLDANLRSAGLEGVFEEVLSTDRIRTYKPDPRASRPERKTGSRSIRTQYPS